MASDTSDTSDTAASTFIDWLTAMTRALGYSRDSELARALQIDQSIVSRWRKGSRPSVEHLARVSALTGTPLEPLLVLADYVPASAVRNAEVPEAPSQVTVGQRMIRNSSLPKEAQELLLEYWDDRMQEERGRLGELINLFNMNGDQFEDTDEVIEYVAKRVFNSQLNVDVAKVLRGMAALMDRGLHRGRKARGATRDRTGKEGTQAPDSREP